MVLNVTDTTIADLVREDAHIVDVLIAERSRTIMAKPYWPLLQPFFHKLLRYEKAITMADTVASMQAEEVFRYLSDMLQLQVSVHGAGRIPVNGPIILVSNHPTGIADGIVLYDAIKARRTDLSIFANRDAVRVNPRLADMIVPVEWRADFKSREKTKETLRNTARAFESGRTVVLFPSGRLAFWNEGRLTERPWMTSAVALARKHKVPVIPMHMGGRNSGLFYFLSRVSTDLRDMTVFNELLNKKRARFSVHFGKAIPSEALKGDLNTLTEKLRVHCAETLGENPDAEFS